MSPLPPRALDGLPSWVLTVDAGGPSAPTSPHRAPAVTSSRAGQSKTDGKPATRRMPPNHRRRHHWVRAPLVAQRNATAQARPPHGGSQLSCGTRAEPPRVPPRAAEREARGAVPPASRRGMVPIPPRALAAQAKRAALPTPTEPLNRPPSGNWAEAGNSRSRSPAASRGPREAHAYTRALAGSLTRVPRPPALPTHKTPADLPHLASTAAAASVRRPRRRAGRRRKCAFDGAPANNSPEPQIGAPSGGSRVVLHRMVQAKTSPLRSRIC